VLRLEQHHPGEERELLLLRRRETALVLIATAIPYATAIVVLIVVASQGVDSATPAAKRPVREADQWKGSGGTGRFPQLPTER
jgi:hypothetical protein